jgi:PAS domain S-box-containing protein
VDLDSSFPGDVSSGPRAANAAFLDAILDNLAHPVFVKDREFRFVLLNRALCEMVGHDREDMVGKTDFDFFPREQATFFREKDELVFETGRVVEVEEERITDADGSQHLLATTKVPLRNDEGRITHVVGIIHDITAIKAAEEGLRRSNDELERRVAQRTAALETAQDELLRKERLAVLGQLAGGVAHQIRNPLGAIANAAAVLRRHVEGDEALQATEIIQEEVRRANGIITELVDYARMRPPAREMVPLRRLVEAALRDHPPPPAVQISSEGAGCDVWVDESQIRDALGNVLRNAYEAMPSGGTVSIGCEHDNRTATLWVCDGGGGMDPELLPRIFEPLVTTKAHGMGLGLTVARALVENHGGSICCAPGPEGGTRFDLHLPRRTAGAEDEGA